MSDQQRLMDFNARKILILSANPKGTPPLRLAEEVREIKEGLKRSKDRDQYQVETAEAVRVRDIRRAILDYEPNIVHFCGHGAREEGLVFEDEMGQEKLVNAEALAGLFELFADQVDCILLNACYSQIQAEAIAKYINYVIGMSQSIGDEAAIEFAVGFYDALGAGRGVEFAYKLGCSTILSAGFSENLTPKLLTKVNIIQKNSKDLEQTLLENLDNGIDKLVQKIRERINKDILKRCDTMKIVGMTNPIGLSDIYVDVNIREQVSRRIPLESSGLDNDLNWSQENFDRMSLRIEERICGLTAVNDNPKLIVWGRPGSGKTTFLKYIALKCIEGTLQANKILIFITLGNFVYNPSNLLTCIYEIVNKDGGGDKITSEQIQKLLQQGKFLFLLDALDEVRREDSRRIIQDIQKFSDDYHQNRFVITCRQAAREYVFQSFIEVDIADFDENQVKTFVNNWFGEDRVKAEKFLNQLQNNPPVKELATTPLLLTLLCLSFGVSFAENRSEIYKNGIDILLEKWDVSRNIERDQIYKNLWKGRKEDLLSKIAYLNFEQKNYLFKQETVENDISAYIQNLPDAKTDPEGLRLDSEVILKSIEAQHGLLIERAVRIYSFSHLTFQEYFTARELRDISNTDELQKLSLNVTDRRWREVFLLLAEMNRDSTKLVVLMKQSIDKFVSENERIQEFLQWLLKKGESVAFYKPAAVRAFYMYRACVHNPYQWIDFNKKNDLYLDHYLLKCIMLLTPNNIDDSSKYEVYLERELDNTISEDMPFIRGLKDHSFPNLDLGQLKEYLKANEILIEHNFPDTFKNTIVLAKNLELQELAQDLESLLVEDNNNLLDKLRNLAINSRNIGHDWKFNQDQKQLIQQYNNANNLLVLYLKKCIIDPRMKKEIENTLLLPYCYADESSGVF